MKRKHCIVLVMFSLLTGVFVACQESKNDLNTNSHKDLRPAVAVDAAVATAAFLLEGVDVTGELSPKSEVAVKAEVAGLVREVFVTEWIPVVKGTPLVRIDLGEQESVLRRAEAANAGAKANLMQAQVMQTRASRELERMKELKESGLATRQALDDARTGEEAEGARVAAAAAQIRAAEEEMRQIRLHLAKGLVTAPIDGVVSERRVNVGDLVGEAGANQPLFHIVDNSVLNLSVSAPSSALAALRRGQTIEFMTDAFPGKTFCGKIKYINPSVGNTDRSVRVMAEVHNGTGELKGGLFVKGRVITKRREGVVLVPRDSLLSWNVAGGTASIYVVEKERARRREVRTGVVDGGGVEIVSGLKSGEQYVARGAFNVKNDDRLLITSGKPGVEK